MSQNLNKLGIAWMILKFCSLSCNIKVPQMCVLMTKKKNTNDFVAKYGNMLDTVPEVMIDTTWDPSVFPHWQAYPLNVDNFGPLKVPAKVKL